MREEDYAAAAALRDARACLLAALPPTRQILFHQIAALQAPGASVQDKLRVVGTLREWEGGAGAGGEGEGGVKPLCIRHLYITVML